MVRILNVCEVAMSEEMLQPQVRKQIFAEKSQEANSLSYVLILWWEYLFWHFCRPMELKTLGVTSILQPLREANPQGCKDIKKTVITRSIVWFPNRIMALSSASAWTNPRSRPEIRSTVVTMLLPHRDSIFYCPLSNLLGGRKKWSIEMKDISNWSCKSPPRYAASHVTLTGTFFQWNIWTDLNFLVMILKSLSFLFQATLDTVLQASTWTCVIRLFQSVLGQNFISTHWQSPRPTAT